MEDMLFIFDMGGVVTTTFHMDTIFNKLGMSKEDFYGICRQDDKDIWEQLQTGKITTEDFWSKFNNKVLDMQKASNKKSATTEKVLRGSPIIKSDLFRLFFHPELNLKTVEIIDKLKKKHRVVCGTNTIQSHWENHMERGDYSVFHQTYASNKIGMAKPDPAFFTTIMEAEEYTNPSEVFFTDDRIDNCQAAASVGINAVHFTTAEDLYNTWQKYF